MIKEELWHAINTRREPWRKFWRFLWRSSNEKGYEKTTIQDIVNALGMSKGAIYHHFKSKDEIIEALSERCYHGDAQMELLRNASDKTGIEKLRAIIYRQIQNEEKKQIDTISINLWKNPKIFNERYGREFECQFPDVNAF